MKKIWIISILAFFLILINIDLITATVTDLNLTGSKAVNRNVIITKNGRANVFLYLTSTTNNDNADAKIWIESGLNTTGGDDSGTADSAANNTILTHCGPRPFRIVNLTFNQTNGCTTGSTAAHGCLRDSSLPPSGFKTGGNSSFINMSAQDSAPTATRERFTFGIKSCNVSGAYDIGVDRKQLVGTFTLNNWFNITVAQTLFRHPADDPLTADRETYYANTTTPPANQTVNLSLRITNEDDIKFHIFSTNVTGTWKNRTASNVRVSGSADTNIVNWTTLDINTSCSAAACSNTEGIGWRFYANDSSRMHNSSKINMIYPQAVVTDSCTPPGSGDWVITDTCYKSNENINLASGGRVLILAGGLLICDRANVTAAGSTPIMIILGESLTKLISKGASNC